MLSSFPYLTDEEFGDACQALQKRCDGQLDDTDWLEIRWQQGALIIKREYYVKPLERPDEDAKSYDPEASSISLGEADNEDEQALMRYNGSGPESVTVDFSIIVSPTYRVPVLWFTLHQVSLNGLSGLDAVYQYLVPSLQKDGARNIGILGGISMAYHPISDLPAFFVHPCNTAEALQEVGLHKDTSPEAYLLLWLGLIGTVVNLHVPSKLLLEQKGY